MGGGGSYGGVIGVVDGASGGSVGVICLLGAGNEGSACGVLDGGACYGGAIWWLYDILSRMAHGQPKSRYKQFHVSLGISGVFQYAVGGTTAFCDVGVI